MYTISRYNLRFITKILVWFIDMFPQQLSVISTIVNQNKAWPYVFRNYCIPHQRQSQYMGEHKAALWQAVRASSAAPGYFDEYHLDGLVHQVKDDNIYIGKNRASMNNCWKVLSCEDSQKNRQIPIQCLEKKAVR